MPSIAIEAIAHCRLSAGAVSAWIDRQPPEHRTPGPGEPGVEILERTDRLCVYRIKGAGGLETTRRVRVAPNRWIYERTSETLGVGRYLLHSNLSVVPEGSGSRLIQATEATPLGAGGMLSSWVARAGQRMLRESASRALAALTLEIEADSGLSVNPRAALGRETAAQRWWTRWSGVRSQYSPHRDWAGAGVFLTGVIGSGLGAFLLVEGVSRAAPSNLFSAAASIAGGAGLVIAAAVGIALLFDRWRTVVGVETAPAGIALRTGRGRIIEVLWSDVGLWGMRLIGERYEVQFRHPRLGTENHLWLTRDHARAILASPFCPVRKTSPVILSTLGLGPTMTGTEMPSA
jgi:hypothetical protein